MYSVNGLLGRACSLILSSSFVQAQLYGFNHLILDEDSDLVAANFKDVPVELLSPAFARPESIPDGFWNGTSGPTDDAEMEYFYRSIASRNPWLTYESTGILTEEGRVLPYMMLSSSAPGCTGSSKLRVFVQGAIHGNEPAGDQAIMALIGKMDADQAWTASVLRHMDILVVPRYSADSVFYFQRPSPSNINPNRDHVKMSSRQTRDIKRFVHAYEPHLVIDMHEFPCSWLHGGWYRQAADIEFGSGRNPNTHSIIRNITENLFVAGAMERSRDRGFRVEPYVDGTGNSTAGSPIVFTESNGSPNSGRNAYGLSQAIAILVEARGVFIGSQHFQRRVAASLAALEDLLEIARDNVGEVKATVEHGIATFIESNDDIVINEVQPRADRNLTMVDTRDGVVSRVSIEFYGMPEANFTRSRPNAYLIPRNWGHLAEHLAVFGIEVETIHQEYHGVVQGYNVTSATLDGWYEDTVRNRVSVEPVQRQLRMPAGSFRVSTRQKNAAFAFVLLEPEAASSFASFGIIPLQESWEYPIFREIH